MKKLTTRIIVASLTFIIGIAATSAWPAFRRSPARSNKLLSGPPCREGLISVEPQLDVPLRISISESDCDNPQVASVHFAVENISSKPISKYQVRSIETYERLVNDGRGVSTGGLSLRPGQTHTNFIGGGVMTGVGGVPAGGLKGYQLTVWSVTFTDGTAWTRTSSR